VWTAARYTTPQPDDNARPLIRGDRTAITYEDKKHMILELAFPEPPPDNGIRAPKAERHTWPSINYWSDVSSHAALTRAP